MIKNHLILLVLIFSSSSPPSWAGHWINPKVVIGNPMIARLQQGRKALTTMEKEEIKKYGYTGLEVMTYLDANLDPGKSHDHFIRMMQIGAGGLIHIRMWLWKTRYYYKDYKSLLTYDGIKPGDTKYKFLVIYLAPPKMWGYGVLSYSYLLSMDYKNPEDVWSWAPDLRKVRRFPTAKGSNNFAGTELTIDEFLRWREPWQEDHRVLGYDVIEGKECIVIESIHRNPQYYLGKRVSWVDKENFIDLHEKQFDREGNLWKVSDKVWKQIKAWNYWVRTEWNCLNIKTNTRTIVQALDWIFD